MPKHPVPKQKTPKSRSASRYHTFVQKKVKQLNARVNLVDCPKCKEKRLSHFVCPNCGSYHGKQIIDMEKKIEKVTKIKA